MCGRCFSCTAMPFALVVLAVLRRRADVQRYMRSSTYICVNPPEVASIIVRGVEGPAIVRPWTTSTRCAASCSENRVIAVVGLSADWFRPSYFAAKYMLEHGYRVIPVNPKYQEVLGAEMLPVLREIPERSASSTYSARPQDVMPIAEDAIAIGARVLWQQLGVTNEAAAARAARGGAGHGHGPVREDRARPPVRRASTGSA